MKTTDPVTARVAVTAEASSRWGIPPVQLGDHRVLRPGRLRWLRTLAWLVLRFFLTAGAFGLPLQWTVDHLPPDDAAPQLVGLVGACVAALGCYAFAVRVGEGRSAGELALRASHAEP